MATLDDLGISESNINDFVLVKDEAGNEYVCKISDLKPAENLPEEQRRKCARNVEKE